VGNLDTKLNVEKMGNLDAMLWGYFGLCSINQKVSKDANLAGVLIIFCKDGTG